MNWVEKYRPKTLDEVVGQDKVKEKLKNWIESFLKGKVQKPILLAGPPGIGKTTLAYALANTYGLDVIELNASDKRNAEHIRRIVGQSATSKSILGNRVLIILDEVDGISSKEDSGGVSELIKIIKKAKNPIILTANDPYSPNLRTLLGYVELIELKPLSVRDIYKVLKKIAEKEGLNVDDKTLRMIAQHSAGDLRSAINDLEALALANDLSYESAQKLPDRDREKNIFDAIRIILKTEKYGIATTALMNVDETPDIVIEWLSENIPNEYEKKEEIAKAFDYLSKADMFLGRAIKTQNYSFWKYATNLMTAGVALSKEHKYRKWTPYRYPKIFRLLAKTKAEREFLKKILKKIAEKTHTSTRRARLELESLKLLSKSNPEKVAELCLFYEFTEEEIKNLFGNDILKLVKKIKENIRKVESKKEKKKGDEEKHKVKENKEKEVEISKVKKEVKEVKDDNKKDTNKEIKSKDKEKEEKTDESKDKKEKKKDKGKQLTLDSFFK
ncbi:replication factor C large subunit [Methanocaldococcus indicus]|uniref:replication factor C large subunit n=1 Tax=Methanocaldococcus indicus TaxID=213231 RepID=UPI003C6CFAB2